MVQSLAKLAKRLILKKQNVPEDAPARSPNFSFHIASHSQRFRSKSVQFQEPFENVIHIDIPRPPPELESKAPNILSTLSPRQSRHVRRKLAAARRWNIEVLPSLIQPYMAYIRMTQSGSVPLTFENGVEHFLCNCPKHALLITCIYLDRQSH